MIVKVLELAWNFPFFTFSIRSGESCTRSLLRTTRIRRIPRNIIHRICGVCTPVRVDFGKAVSRRAAADLWIDRRRTLIVVFSLSVLSDKPRAAEGVQWRWRSCPRTLRGKYSFPESTSDRSLVTRLSHRRPLSSLLPLSDLVSGFAGSFSLGLSAFGVSRKE